MRDIPEFKIDKWVEQYGAKAQIALHGSNVLALSLAELQGLAADGGGRGPVDADLQLGYGVGVGSVGLRERIAELNSTSETKLTAENVIITPGSIMANYLALATLCGPGDHVICQYPTFAQLYVIPRQYGAEVSLWTMREEHDWIPRVEELAAMIKPNTRAIILNNPNNPTGTILSRDVLEEIVQLAQKSDITVYSDEVFSPLFHSPDTTPPPPPLMSLGYTNSIVTGSVSKSRGLPGIRVGWVISPSAPVLERIVKARDYTTIAVSQLDDGVAAFALSPAVLPALMERNLAICRRSIDLVGEFVREHAASCRWVVPRGAGTAFVRFLNPDGSPVDDVAFATRLFEEAGVSVVPGRCFADGPDEGLQGFIRLTLGDAEKLREGLQILGGFLDGKKPVPEGV